jgi:hypothetical protein
LANDYVEDVPIPLTGPFSLAQNPNHDNEGVIPNPPLLNLNDFIRQNFESQFRAVSFELLGQVYTAVVTRSPEGSTPGYTPVISSNRFGVCP